MIVEDDASVQVALGDLFSREGYEVAIAHDGVEAIQLLEEGARPSVMFVDLLMPGIVGNELLDYVGDDPVLSRIPVAIISGSPQLAPAGYKVFTKPLDAAALVEFLRAALSPDGQAPA
jgi:CheY-like chemotaxis protein